MVGSATSLPCGCLLASCAQEQQCAGNADYSALASEARLCWCPAHVSSAPGRFQAPMPHTNIASLARHGTAQHLQVLCKACSMRDARACDGSTLQAVLQLWCDAKALQSMTATVAWTPSCNCVCLLWWNATRLTCGCRAVACGLAHTVCLTAKDVLAWGSNTFGQLGHGDNSAEIVALPQAIKKLHDIPVTQVLPTPAHPCW
jgi:Regulator of chromosome condensation (RCC1) repeat